MVISFGGLATGLDTNSIVSALMEIEREPIVRMEKEKEYLSNRLKAFSEFETKLDALNGAIDELNSPEKLGSFTTRSGSEDYFSLSVTNTSLTTPGSYQMEVENLAQVRKDVSRHGYTESDSGNFTSGRLIINGTRIDFDANQSLNDIRDAINDADKTSDTGVTASTIYDGTTYRLVLTGKDADTNFTVSSTGLRAEGRRLRFDNIQAAERAEVNIDGISITSKNNRLENAIPGVSIDLLKENTPGESTTISIESDYSQIAAKMETFATAYNDINSYIQSQQDASWGNDPAFKTVVRNMRNLLVSQIGDGTYNHLVDIGFKSDSRTGQLSIDSAKLNEALAADYDSVESLLTGDGSSSGIFDQFTHYLEEWTDSINGLYAGKKSSYDTTVRSLDQSIERMELRLEKREQTLLAQFSAMEELVNSMNATSSYMTQQLSTLPSLGSN